MRSLIQNRTLNRIVDALLTGELPLVGASKASIRRVGTEILAHKMSPEEKEAQRRSFAYGNVKVESNLVTREMVAQAAEELEHSREVL